MPYADESAIQAEFKSIDFSDSNSAINSDKVNDFILQEEAVLNAEIATIYVTPITGSPATYVMKRMSIFMVKARVIDLLSVKTGNQKLDQGGGDVYREMVREMLDRIKKKELILSGATLLQSGGGVGSYSNSNNLDQVFKRETEQW